MLTRRIKTSQEDYAQPWPRGTNTAGSRSSHIHPDRQLKENKKNYMKFLLETAAAWGMDNFNEYLKGSKFMLYKDLITEPSLGTTQVKTLNRLKTAMSEHNFETRNRQKSNFLKMGQTDTLQTHMGNLVNFNEAIHVDTFCTTRMVIITITDDSMAFSVSTIITDNSTTSLRSLVQNIRISRNNLFQTREGTSQ
jgi:hypothetical protein